MRPVALGIRSSLFLIYQHHPCSGDQLQIDDGTISDLFLMGGNAYGFFFSQLCGMFLTT